VSGQDGSAEVSGKVLLAELATNGPGSAGDLALRLGVERAAVDDAARSAVADGLAVQNGTIFSLPPSQAGGGGSTP
jgi:hypothetical protein